MPCAPLAAFTDLSDQKKTEAGEVMAGVLEFVNVGNSGSLPASGILNNDSRRCSIRNWQRVFVRVYRTSHEHFAVLYPIRAIVAACRPLASLNLKSCCVKSLAGSGKEFRVSPRACEGVSVTFRALAGTTESQMADWMKSFTDNQEVLRMRKISDHKPLLPVLQESEEEDELSQV